MLLRYACNFHHVLTITFFSLAQGLDMPLMHHATKIRQELAVDCLSGFQDESFFEAQLLRAISLALTTVGFDSVKPSALEAFRAETETCKASLSGANVSVEAHFILSYYTSSRLSGPACTRTVERNQYLKTSLPHSPMSTSCHMSSWNISS